MSGTITTGHSESSNPTNFVYSILINARVNLKSHSNFGLMVEYVNVYEYCILSLMRFRLLCFREMPLMRLMRGILTVLMRCTNLIGFTICHILFKVSRSNS
jgi:hypothetical protein